MTSSLVKQVSALEFARTLHALPADGALVVVRFQLLRRCHRKPAGHSVESEADCNQCLQKSLQTGTKNTSAQDAWSPRAMQV